MCLLFSFALISATKAQVNNDSISKKQNWNFHFQNTVITQYHPPIHAPYSGMNSLNPNAESATSITSTLFFGTKIWKNAELYINPELSGGSGFSATTGVAGFTNGEVYRVSDPLPKIYMARFFIKQVFPLINKNKKISDQYELNTDEINQIATLQPKSYIAIYAGRFSIMDYFDDNKYSHDPRSQFYNWALMGNAAWDYPANTRGYTNGLVAELVKPEWAVRLASVMVPTIANGAIMDPRILQSNSEAVEFEHNYHIGKQKGKIRLMAFFTSAQMGNYKEAIEWGKQNDTFPNLNVYHAYSRTKFGAGINIEHGFNDNVGMFFRASWNDGRNETWAFTEIDRHASIGLSLNGALWNRKNDNFGLAQLVNGISKDHRDFLSAGGYGFIIGDGKLNYEPECISELYYSFRLTKYKLWITPDYQFILHPAYNKDRGPVQAFGVRMHIEI